MIYQDLISGSLFRINLNKLSKIEKLIFESDLFVKLCEELKLKIKIKYHSYFRLLKFNLEMENQMIDGHLIKYIVEDIVATGEYTLPGIAYHTHIPEEVLYDIAIGRNADPSSTLFRKILKLHKSVRPSLYEEMIKKIISEYNS